MPQAKAKTVAKSANGSAAQAASQGSEQTPRSAADAQRQQAIAERAYHKAEARDFAPGSEEQDWLDAEREFAEAEVAEAPAPKQ